MKSTSPVAIAPKPQNGVSSSRKRQNRHEEQEIPADYSHNSELDADVDSDGANASLFDTTTPTHQDIQDVINSLGMLPRKRPARKKTSPEQLAELVSVFEKTDSPSFETREVLSKKLGMSNREIQIWFQNRRGKVKRERLQAENPGMKKSASSRSTSNNQTPVSRYPKAIIQAPMSMSQYQAFGNARLSPLMINPTMAMNPQFGPISPTAMGILRYPQSPTGQMMMHPMMYASNGMSYLTPQMPGQQMPNMPMQQMPIIPVQQMIPTIPIQQMLPGLQMPRHQMSNQYIQGETTTSNTQVTNTTAGINQHQFNNIQSSSSLAALEQDLNQVSPSSAPPLAPETSTPHPTPMLPSPDKTVKQAAAKLSHNPTLTSPLKLSTTSRLETAPIVSPTFWVPGFEQGMSPTTSAFPSGMSPMTYQFPSYYFTQQPWGSPTNAGSTNLPSTPTLAGPTQQPTYAQNTSSNTSLGRTSNSISKNLQLDNTTLGKAYGSNYVYHSDANAGSQDYTPRRPPQLVIPQHASQEAPLINSAADALLTAADILAERQRT
ncbi:hypothetical protein SmJEL517_g05181 [Synchytrium microbalum]|uniref:Homeobox domain-containing protein n=1 Tax=Synchytrium microbalum TaxID=1806994 RepID=A0A507C1S0_9FUNG|nr:uncharacterized protein SmJEL517_g05181 [Synchytrium microbalum]TPX31475.1 hypothetical protein SmJEL517_g05181 [Synchytrium microbalum]